MKDVITVSREIPVIKIALTAKLRAGKDTVADHLHIRHSFDKVAFGDALKRNVNETFPWLTGPKKPRALLQQYGQLMREIDPQVWVRHVERKVNGIIDLRVNTGADRIGIVISDLRQPNELEWARANGYTIIRITAPKGVRMMRAFTEGDSYEEADLEHETERHVDSFAVDYEIVNDGTVDDLKRKIDEILEAIY